MPLIDITNPDVIKFLVESYDKTTRLKIKWNNLHREKLQQAATLHPDAKGYVQKDVLKETMALGMATITRDHITAGYNRRRAPIRDGTQMPRITDLKKGHSIPEVGLGSIKDDPRLGRPATDLSFDPIMRPVDSKEKEIIYKDLPTFGRKSYLMTRCKKPPEKRYYFAEVSDWQYGWRLGEAYCHSGSGPTYGRVWRLSRNTMSRTGPHPDPSYYRSSDTPGPMKCNMT